MLGTTHATNAVLERRDLRRVAVIRIGGPATHSIRPMFSGPPTCAARSRSGAAIVDGGIEFDGRDLSPLDTDAIARFLGQVGEHGRRRSRSPACSPRSRRATSCWRPRWSSASSARCTVSLSHEIGSLGLLERENATILNGALAGVARDVAAGHAGGADRARPAAGDVLRPERRHADGPGPGPAVPGAHHRQRPGQQRPRRGLPDRAAPTPWSPTWAAPPPTSACWSTAFPGSPRTGSRSAASGPTSGCRTWSRSRSAAAP